MAPRFFNVPNQLTLLRLGFLPLFLIFIIYDHYRWALAVLLIAAVTDGLDGLLARRLNQRTAIGAYLDPIADKMLLSSSFLVLALKGKIHWWVTVVVLARDGMLLTTAVVIILVAGYRRFPPSIWGKITTAVQIVLVFVVVTQAALPAIGLDSVQTVLRYAVAFFTCFSGLHYSVTVARRLSGS
jgi:cardiolipin synthase (CMP-forming)